jgi:hypothetical protein
MGKFIISENERKHILSLYESNMIPPPSESVLIANKNPFKYPEYESARRTYSSDLKDGDMFYITIKKHNYERKIEIEFYDDFVKGLYNKTARYDDNIYRFLSPNTDTPYSIGIQVNDGNINDYSLGVYEQWSVTNISFNIITKGFGQPSSISIPSITELFNKQYQQIVTPKLQIENIPDEYFEIRKIKREQTDF